MVAEDAEDANQVGPARPAKRIATTVLRIIRDTKVSQQVKALNGYTCQVCRTQLMCVGGPYAEAAHIRPLGKPHNGPDVVENLLCLCSNHHVLFDHGGFVIDEDYLLQGLGEPTPLLGMTKPHQQYLAYHRGLWRLTSILIPENSRMIVT